MSKKITAPINATPATLPTTAPAITPVFDFSSGGLDDVGEGAAVLPEEDESVEVTEFVLRLLVVEVDLSEVGPAVVLEGASEVVGAFVVVVIDASEVDEGEGAAVVVTGS